MTTHLRHYKYHSVLHLALALLAASGSVAVKLTCTWLAINDRRIIHPEKLLEKLGQNIIRVRLVFSAKGSGLINIL